MLGLRGSPFSRHSSGNPSSSPNPMADQILANGHDHDIPGKSMRMKDQSLEMTNGHSNGVSSNNESYSNGRSAHHSEDHKATMSLTTERHITVLRESVTIVRRKLIAELEDVDESSIECITVENVFDYIERQRLTYMPHRGSHWDKVLKWAEFFALQVSGYASALETFVPESKIAVRLILTASQSLLSLGPDNAQALETSFGVFYRLGLSIATLLRNSTLLSANGQIRREVGQTLNIILLLVRDVTFFYRLKLRGPEREARFDFNAVFGGQIAAFYQRKNHAMDAMWEYALGDEATIEVRALRKWLGPHDAGLQKLLKAEESGPTSREEFTCNWFQSHLLSFTRSKHDILSISAEAGCGKSVITNWIVERLQRPVGKKAYVTLSCALEADIPAENSPLAVIKRLLLQMLENNLGHKKFFTNLTAAYRASTSSDVRKIEEMLWGCLDTGLHRLQNTSHTMLIVDGLDEVQGGEKASRAISNKLGDLSNKHPNVQVITTSRDSSLKPNKGKTFPFAISADHTHEDLRIVIDRQLEGYKHFDSRSEHARENLVEQLLHAAKGNFLWGILTAALARRETSEDAFVKAVKAAKETPLTLEATIAKMVNTIDFGKPDAGLFLSLMLVAKRPLTSQELKLLSEIDLAKHHNRDRKTDIKNDVSVTLGSLVKVRNGSIRFYHSTIRSHLLRVQDEGKKLRNRAFAESDMVTRLLAYCHFSLPMIRDPVFELAGHIDSDSMFSKYALLEYAVRSWSVHFQSSVMFKDHKVIELTEEFKAVFPSTTQLALLEWACWSYESPEAIKVFDISLRVRQAALSENHVSVLQTLIVCGSFWRETTHTTQAAECFYHASKIGQKLLSKYHAVIAACTTAFLTITESMTTTTRTEIVIHKEELLIYTIEMYKYQHSKTHDLVIQYSKLLAQLYVEIHEDHKAEAVWRELREIMIIRFGKGSEEETSISESLTIVLKKGDKKTDVVEYEQGMFEIITELEVWNIRRIKLTIELGLSYEARGEFLKAEELFIFLWRRLTEQCHHSHHRHGVEIHIHLIEVVIEYVRFLRRCNRQEEASSVLLCIWTEYEEYDFESEVIFLRLKVVGELMRSVSLLPVAVAVFKKCWAWFKSHSKAEHVASCELLITETVEEITTVSTSTTVTKSTTTATTSETVIKEIFESSLSQTTVTIETISVCKNLVSHYMKLEQWSLAIEVTRRSLLQIWKSIISGSGTIALPRDFGAGAIEIATSLAICYHRSQYYHEAEEIYVRIYRACRNSCQIDDERLTKAYMVLVKFYEEHKHWHKIIEIYQELLVEYRKHLGASHHHTIRFLYILASLTADYGYGHAHEYYEEIINVLNTDSHICHYDAVDAMIFICTYHYEVGHWQRLQKVCKILWETWKGQHRGHEKFTVDFVEVLYFRYRYVLEHHVHCEFALLRELTIEYRETCLRVYGVSIAITIKAMIELAQIYMRSEKHIHEAISIYEEVLTQTKTTKTTTVVSETTITMVRKCLAEAYVSICSHESVSQTTIERAIKVIIERYNYLRITLGWAHTETLTTLREVVLLYIKSKKQESHTVVVRMLVEASIHIIIKEKHSQTLHEAGRSVGNVFLNCGMSQIALEIIQELRLQIITGATSSNNRHGVKVEKSASRLSFVFLVTLEQVVKGALSASYSEVMSDYLIESIYYESYTHSLKSSATVIIGHAARLHAFLVSHERHHQREVLEKQSYDIFVKKWSINARSRDIGMLFYVSLLLQIGDSIREVQVGNIACMSAVAEVRRLLEKSHIQQAYEVAECALDFINHQRAYHHLQNIPAGFKLSSLLAGRGIDQSILVKVDPKLRESMYELSRKIIKEVLQACKESKIDFVRLKLDELNDLVGLLGEQHNFDDLEWILTLLWASREVQKTWAPPTIIAIGRLLVCARYLNGTSSNSRERRSSAIRLCEDICYNMRRTWGSLDLITLEMSDLLSTLYTNMGHHREAQGVHENNLRLVVEGDDGDDRTLDTMEAPRVLAQLDLLKQTFLRLHGWDKSPETYTDLIAELKAMPEYKPVKQIQSLTLLEKWNPKDPASDTVGRFHPPKEWDFVHKGHMNENGEIRDVPRRPGMNVKRATSNWGLGLVHKFLHGDHEHKHPNGGTNVVNGDGKINGKKVITLDDEEEGYASAEERPGVVHVKEKPLGVHVDY